MIPSIFEETQNGLTLKLRVQPGAKRARVILEPGKGLKVYLQEPATDGKANRALMIQLSKLFGVPKSKIELLQGKKDRNKVIRFPTDYVDLIRATLEDLLAQTPAKTSV